jgi:hypothetical protein
MALQTATATILHLKRDPGRPVKTAGRGIQSDRHTAFAKFPWPQTELSQASPDQRFSLHERIGTKSKPTLLEVPIFAEVPPLI